MAIYSIGRSSASATTARYLNSTAKTRWNQVDITTTLPNSKKIQYFIYGSNDGASGGQSSKVVPVGIRRRDTGEILHQTTITIANNTNSFKQSAVIDVDLPSGVEIEIGFASQSFGFIAIWAGTADAAGSYQESNGVGVIENPSILNGTSENFRYVLYANIETIAPITSVDSFNGANNIERGQQNVAYTTTGFATITGISTSTTGVTVSGINDTAGDGDCDISDYQEGGFYPVLPASVQYTFTDGTLTANITKTLSVKDGELSTIASGSITGDNTFLPYWLQLFGRSTADGCQYVYSPGPQNVNIDPDGTVSCDNATVLTFWYRDVSNGRSYQFIATLNDSGQVIVVESGLTRQGLTSQGLSSSGLTSAGL